jgi:hypothetical protein
MILHARTHLLLNLDIHSALEEKDKRVLQHIRRNSCQFYLILFILFSLYLKLLK